MTRKRKRTSGTNEATSLVALLASTESGSASSSSAEGRSVVSASALKDLTRFARRGEAALVRTFEALLRALRAGKRATPSRPLSLQAIDALFQRSGRFRTLCVDAIDAIVGHTWSDSDAALRRQLVAMMRAWAESHGNQHARLRMADAAVQRRALALRGGGTGGDASPRVMRNRERTERQRRQVALLQRERVQRELSGSRVEIESNLDEMDRMLELLGSAPPPFERSRRSEAAAANYNASSSGILRGAATAAEEAAEEDIEWEEEDVGGDAAASCVGGAGAAPSPSSPSLDAFSKGHGLGDAAYELQLAVPVSISAIAGASSTRTLLCEKLLDGYKLVVRRHAPLVRDWDAALVASAFPPSAAGALSLSPPQNSSASATATKRARQAAGGGEGDRALVARVKALRQRVATTTLKCVAIGLQLNTRLKRAGEEG